MAQLDLVDCVSKAIDDHLYSAGVFIDLKKAFDTINLNILLQKLDHYGIRGIPNQWFRSYLSDRKQSVCLNGVVSNSQPVICGVPQRSILGNAYNKC